MFELLKTIDSPSDLRRLHPTALGPLADELRAYILHSVASTGGHLSANLGTVELAIALHYVFDTPDDRIVWDVGHQTYAHKILTGRREAMSSIRQLGGISGFPRRSESSFDAFGTAHSSTSISAALGMALATYNKKEKRHCVAVIGDGALSGGMAYEALNNAGVHKDLSLLVVLNDNDMSISPSVGALRQHLVELAQDRMEVQHKGITPSVNLFKSLGFNYIGPIDGHNLCELLPALQSLKDLRGPQLLHIITKKGHGYSPAVADPIQYHGPGKFNPIEGILPSVSISQTYTQIFSEWLCDEAERDPCIVAITPAMREGSGLVAFEQRFPERYFDVGIAEQHALTFAAGLACEGLRPVVAIYSTFLQRAYDQLIHDIAIQNLPVVFAIDRAGIVGADGATHTGAFDIAYLRCVPNLTIMAPGDENECRQMLHTALLLDGPAIVRYPRRVGSGQVRQPQLTKLPLGKGEIRRVSGQTTGCRVAILAFGSMLLPALEVAETIDASLANMRFIKPLDGALIEQFASSHDVLVILEEGCVMGGGGSACLEHLITTGLSRPVLQLGLADQFIEHGTSEQLLAASGLDVAGIITSIQDFLTERSYPIVETSPLFSSSRARA